MSDFLEVPNSLKYPLDMVGYYDKMSMQPARARFSKRERKVDTTPATAR